MRRDKTGSHTSVRGPLKRTVERLQNSPLVKKVVLGAASGKDSAMSQGAIRIRREIDAGFVATAQGHCGCRDVFIYCSRADREAVRRLIGAG